MHFVNSNMAKKSNGRKKKSSSSVLGKIGGGIKKVGKGAWKHKGKIAGAAALIGAAVLANEQDKAFKTLGREFHPTRKGSGARADPPIAGISRPYYYDRYNKKKRIKGFLGF